MKKIDKVIKLITFLKKKDSNFYLDHWKVKNKCLYELSWDVGHHNGDIDNYKEELVKHGDERLNDLLTNLETDYEEFVREEELLKLVKKGLKKIYEN